MKMYLCALACGMLVFFPACVTKKKETTPAPTSVVTTQEAPVAQLEQPVASQPAASQPVTPVAAQPEVTPQEPVGFDQTGLDQDEAQSYQNDKMEDDLQQELALK